MTKFLSIMGAKDRVGASSFAFKMACFLKERGFNPLLLDYDVSHLGDLKVRSDAKVLWRSLDDLEKLPRPFKPQWLFGFLKGPCEVASLSLAGNRSQLKSLDPKGSLEKFLSISSYFDWVVADLGSRWNPFNVSFLKKTDSLFFVLNAELSLVEELKRKLEELSLSFFPKKRIGWVGWRWDSRSFLTLESVAEALPVNFLGEDPLAVWKKWGSLNGNKEELLSFVSEKLLASGPRTLGPTGPTNLEATPQNDNKMELLKWIQDRMEKEGVKVSSEGNLNLRITKIICEVLEEKNEMLPAQVNRGALIEELLDEIIGLGPLEPLLKAPNFTEILINGTRPIYVEEKGRLKETPFRFLNREHLQKTIEKILLPQGRRVDESSPMVDCRLPDGSRVNIIIGPAVLEGPVVSIRRFSKKVLLPKDLSLLGSADEEMLNFLNQAVLERKNILVSGGTGSGKTTLLNCLSFFIPSEERVITIEDACELCLNQPHVVRLEARPPSIEGKGEITIRDLVRNSLRMRPDRIIVGECRGGETLDMLQAMNTGHEGSLTTLHANSPRDALSRLETLVLFAGMELPSKAIREQIASAIDWIVQVARLSDGSRKIISITKVLGLENEKFLLQDLFQYADGHFKKLVS